MIEWTKHKGIRIYIQHTHNGRNELVSWMQKRCSSCGRFLNKYAHNNTCSKCSHKNHLEYSRILSFVKYHINDLNIGDAF